MTSDKDESGSAYMLLGRELYRLRSMSGLSLRQAAKSIGGLSHSRLQDFERGEDPHSARPTRPSEDQLRRIAKAYSVDPVGLLRLAGYATVGPLTPWEEDLILRARAVPFHCRESVVEYLTKLTEED